jgi:predicted component of type VI protein secretion system
MAKLFLKFEQAVLKEVSLTQGVVTIGRLPDNVIQVDNLAVSGHHAKIYWDEDKFIIEDNNSLNGTYLNNRRISKAALKDNDVVLIGKHTIAFKDEWHEGSGAPPAAAEKSGPAAPKLEATMVLDTKKAKEMLAAAQAASSAGAIASTGTVAEANAAGAPAPAAPAKERTGVLTVLDGKTDAPTYRLTSKMTVIGKSDMASIKLKGFFAPNMAGMINKRDNKYFVAASEAKIKVKINGAEIAGQKELNEGDIIEVAGIKMNFSFE